MIFDLSAFARLFKKGDYDIISQAYPIVAVVGFIGYLTFYLTNKSLGLHENINLRLIAASLFIPLIFLKKDFARLKIFIVESILIGCLPLFTSYLYFSTSEHIILSAEFIFCGFVYGLLTGKIMHTITVFPLFVMIGYFLSDHFFMKTTMFQFFKGSTLISISIVTAFLSSLFKLIFDSMLIAKINSRGQQKRLIEEEAVRGCADYNRNLERNLSTIKKLDTISKLSGGLVEDFISMTKIISSKSMDLKNWYVGNKNKIRRIDTVLDVINKSSHCINRIKVFALTDNEACNIDINLILNELTDLLKETLNKNIRITCDLSALKTYVFGNKEMLEQAFLNICINASHAMPDGGVLLITTENRRNFEEFIPDTNPFEQIVIHFKDTGSGMDQKTRENIFKPFFSTKGKGNGSGLGLVMVYETITSHNGKITVDSTLRRGTTFSITLPVISL